MVDRDEMHETSGDSGPRGEFAMTQNNDYISNKMNQVVIDNFAKIQDEKGFLTGIGNTKRNDNSIDKKTINEEVGLQNDILMSDYQNAETRSIKWDGKSDQDPKTEKETAKMSQQN